MIYLKLYTCINPDTKLNIIPQEINTYKLICFKPSFFKVCYKRTNWLKSISWYFINWGNYEILYLLDQGRVIHYSYIMSKNFRFPFMNQNDLQIGPCFTHKDYRGKGLYTSILKLIPSLYSKQYNQIWIYTMNTNVASQKAIEKAGYIFFSLIVRKGFLKRLHIVKTKRQV